MNPIAADYPQLLAILEGAGWPLAKLIEHGADGVALVGSRTVAGCAREDSDWDLVILTDRRSILLKTEREASLERRVFRDQLDVLVETKTHDPEWYSRELAIHMSEYAVWLHGEQHWGREHLRWDAAVEFKRRRLVREVDRLEKSIPMLSQHIVMREASRLRDWARVLVCLERRTIIPPRRMLPTFYEKELLVPIEEYVEKLPSMEWSGGNSRG